MICFYYSYYICHSGVMICFYYSYYICNFSYYICHSYGGTLLRVMICFYYSYYICHSGVMICFYYSYYICHSGVMICFYYSYYICHSGVVKEKLLPFLSHILAYCVTSNIEPLISSFTTSTCRSYKKKFPLSLHLSF